MRSKHVLATLIGVVVTAGLLATATPVRAAATTICVKLDGAGPCHDTIQDAVDAAVVVGTPGQTIKISKGTYFENVTIPAGVDGLILTGSKSIIDPDDPNLGPAFNVLSDNVVFSKLIIRHGNEDGIFIDATASGAQILGLQFFGPDTDCVDSDGPGLLVEDSTFVGCGSNAVEGDGGSGTTAHVITGNDMSKCGSVCINLGSNTPSNDVLVEDNSIFQGDGGIEIDGVGADVLDNEMENLDDDGIAVDGATPIVTGNSMLNVDGTGVELNNDSGALVEDNELENTQTAIDSDGPSADILGNSITNARGDGIAATDTDSDFVLVQDNEVEIADGDGIAVSGEDPTVLDNQVSITSTGFDIDCTPCSVLPADLTGFVQGNTSEDAFNGDAFNIDADAPGGLRVLENEAVEPQDNGFQITGNGTIAEDNTVEDAGEDASDDGFRVEGADHQIRRNEVGHSADDGFHICGTGHKLEENTTYDNIEDGFDIHGEGCGTTSGTILNTNEATDNLAVGFEVSTGATGTTLNTNEASDNQRGDFCDNGTGTVVAPDNEFDVPNPLPPGVDPCPVD